MSYTARSKQCTANFSICCFYHGLMKMNLRISIKNYRCGKIGNQTGFGSIAESSSAGSHKILQIIGQIGRKTCNAVMLRSGANLWRSARARCSPARATRVRARRKRTRLRFLNAGRDERAGNDERRAGATLARPPCQFPPVGPGGFTRLQFSLRFYASRINRWLSPKSLSGSNAPSRLLQKSWQIFRTARRFKGAFGSLTNSQSANSFPRLPA